MKERPIIFSAGMARAILEGRKTQTRRIAKEKDTLNVFIDDAGKVIFKNCPYGFLGDRLWVREAWQAWAEVDNLAPSELAYSPSPAYDASYQNDRHTRVNYLADGNSWDSKRRSSIHMPRWASRILLEIIEIRLQRLHQISEEDAQAEGVELNYPVGHIPNAKAAPYVYGYVQLWEEINGKGSWESNPWVWVITFKQVQP